MSSYSLAREITQVRPRSEHKQLQERPAPPLKLKFQLGQIRVNTTTLVSNVRYCQLFCYQGYGSIHNMRLRVLWLSSCGVQGRYLAIMCSTSLDIFPQASISIHCALPTQKAAAVPTYAGSDTRKPLEALQSLTLGMPSVGLLRLAGVQPSPPPMRCPDCHQSEGMANTAQKMANKPSNTIGGNKEWIT
eukprot:1159811-Pelagomonas_calceolata.AAC.4